MFWWIFATLCAFFVKGLCGFANSLVFTTLLSFGNNNVSISPIELLLGYPSNLIISLRERKSIQWKMCIPLALLVIAGSIPGVFFLKNMDTSLIKKVFGIVIVFIGFEMFLREYQKKKAKESKALLLFIGVLSGILCGLYGVGAVLSAYINRVTDDSSSFKANICMVFVIENTFRIILYSIWRILTLDVIRRVLSLAPFMILGLSLGIFSGKFIKESIVQKLVILLLIISGVALILR